MFCKRKIRHFETIFYLIQITPPLSISVSVMYVCLRFKIENRYLNLRSRHVHGVRDVSWRTPNVGDVRNKDVRRIELEEKRKFRFVCV